MRKAILRAAILAGLFGLGACSTQPTESGAGGSHFVASCPEGSTSAASAGGHTVDIAGTPHFVCIMVVTNSSPTTSTPTSTNTVPVSVTVPVSAVPSIP
ncbi:MAG TPA: hypothetical protein VNU19_07130 [Candidatus Acidoferrum sp.]|nr:hypothetical protein [Candidatus Acidoferrum sp.]